MTRAVSVPRTPTTGGAWPPIDGRLAVPVAFAWAVLAVSVSFPGALTALAVTSWALAGAGATLAISTARGRRVVTAASVACAIAALLLTSAAAQSPQRSPAMLQEAAEASRHVRAELVLAEATDAGSDRVRATIVVATVGDARLERLQVPVVVFNFAAPPGCCSLWSTVSLAGTLRATEPGDGAAYLFFARGAADEVRGPPWFLEWANGVRSGFSEATAALPGEGGDLLAGLAIGDTSAVSNGLDQAMIDTALSHLTAVSGANCAVVVGLVMMLGSALGLSRRMRIGSALVTLLGFVVLVTPEASVVRAA